MRYKICGTYCVLKRLPTTTGLSDFANIYLKKQKISFSEMGDRKAKAPNKNETIFYFWGHVPLGRGTNH